MPRHFGHFLYHIISSSPSHGSISPQYLTRQILILGKPRKAAHYTRARLSKTQVRAAIDWLLHLPSVSLLLHQVLRHLFPRIHIVWDRVCASAEPRQRLSLHPSLLTHKIVQRPNYIPFTFLGALLIVHRLGLETFIIDTEKRPGIFCRLYW